MPLLWATISRNTPSGTYFGCSYKDELACEGQIFGGPLTFNHDAAIEGCFALRFASTYRVRGRNYLFRWCYQFDMAGLELGFDYRLFCHRYFRRHKQHFCERHRLFCAFVL